MKEKMCKKNAQQLFAAEFTLKPLDAIKAVKAISWKPGMYDFFGNTLKNLTEEEMVQLANRFDEVTSDGDAYIPNVILWLHKELVK